MPNDELQIEFENELRELVAGFDSYQIANCYEEVEFNEPML
jgi:hypothetical protein